MLAFGRLTLALSAYEINPWSIIITHSKAHQTEATAISPNICLARRMLLLF